MIGDHELARDLAHRAGELLTARQRRNHRSSTQGWWLGQDADAEANDYLVDRLREVRPADAVLSEESPDDLDRLAVSRTWIIDPLDGSDGFGHGQGDWAVHVALTEDGDPTAASVAVPALETTFSTLDIARRDPIERAPIVVVGRTRVRSDGGPVAEALGGRLTVCSSAGVKAMLVVAGEADVYVHAAPLYEWDVCAPAAVARSAGLWVSDPDGRPLRFNRRERPVVDGLVICLHDEAPRVLAAIE